MVPCIAGLAGGAGSRQQQRQCQRQRPDGRGDAGGGTQRRQVAAKPGRLLAHVLRDCCRVPLPCKARRPHGCCEARTVYRISDGARCLQLCPPAVNQALLCTALGLPPSFFRRFSQSNASFTVLDFEVVQPGSSSSSGGGGGGAADGSSSAVGGGTSGLRVRVERVNQVQGAAKSHLLVVEQLAAGWQCSWAAGCWWASGQTVFASFGHQTLSIRSSQTSPSTPPSWASRCPTAWCSSLAPQARQKCR